MPLVDGPPCRELLASEPARRDALVHERAERRPDRIQETLFQDVVEGVDHQRAPVAACVKGERVDDGHGAAPGGRRRSGIARFEDRIHEAAVELS